ncbi:Transposase TnpA [Bacillus cereus AH1271]|nr:Transposase TnpA [Bacillus cereus AH1271]
MLNLPEFNVILKEQNEHFYRFTVERNELPYLCTKCGWIKTDLFEEDRTMHFKVHQIKEKTVSDISQHGKAVRIVIRHKRYRCPACEQVFTEDLDSVERNDKVTKRLKEYIKKLALKRPFTNISDEYGISHTSVRRYFEEFVEEMEQDRVLVAPRVLGIDEAHLNKTMRGVFTDTENNRLLEITKDNTKRTTKETILSMEGYKNIEVATVDMYAGYKNALKEVVPECFVVIDKFHVVQYAMRALDAVRIAIKKSLPKTEQRILKNDRWIMLKNQEDLTWTEIQTRIAWFERFPELGKAYWLKEGLRDIYKLSKSKEEAIERFDKWVASIPTEFTQFKEAKKTFTNNKKEIFNYFDNQYTNAYTESVNNIIKSVEKAGKGYSFEVLRAKVLYGTQATLKKPKYNETMQFQRFDKI